MFTLKMLVGNVKGRVCLEDMTPVCGPDRNTVCHKSWSYIELI
jgi:hypothetical protein